MSPMSKPTPPRPALDSLLAAAAAHWDAMSEAEREALMAEQRRNIAPYKPGARQAVTKKPRNEGAPMRKHEAVVAIEFALAMDDRGACSEFLTEWMHGDTKGWPEWPQFLKDNQ